jgi:phosphohistidine phosphatase
MAERTLMSERTLILLRHAKSDWSGNEADVDRPLSKRGLRQAPDAGRWFGPALTARPRCRLTCDPCSQHLAARLGRNSTTGRRPISKTVYAAPASQLLGVVRVLPDDLDTVVLVGHNPGIEDLVSLLTGEWEARIGVR